jgi:hypothetical protein
LSNDAVLGHIENIFCVHFIAGVQVFEPEMLKLLPAF